MQENRKEKSGDQEIQNIKEAGDYSSDYSSDCSSDYSSDYSSGDYNPILPKRVFIVKVRYVFRGKGWPLYYPVKD